MTDHPLHDLEVRSRPLKRAQYEAFAFSLLEGDVLVRNESHADPSNHEYLVTIKDGLPTACECPADSKYDWACKHRLAVAIRPRILQTVQWLQATANGDLLPGRAVMDGGTAAVEDRPRRLADGPGQDAVRTGRRFIPDGPLVDD